MDDFTTKLVGLRRKLLNYATKLTGNVADAEDLVQDTIIKALESRASFVEGSNLSAWVTVSMYNRFVGNWRRDKNRVSISMDDPDTTALASKVPSQHSRLVSRELVGAFKRLSVTEKRMLLLSAVEGWTYQRIADAENISIGTVKSRICRARDRLLLQLGEDNDIGRRKGQYEEIVLRNMGNPSSPKHSVLSKRPKWICVREDGMSRIMDGKTMIIEKVNQTAAWYAADKLLKENASP